MLLQYQVLQSMSVCHYKAWLLYKEEIEDQLQLQDNAITFPHGDIPFHKIALSAWFKQQSDDASFVEVFFEQTKTATIRLRSCAVKMERLLDETRKMIAQTEPPPFYKNKHCAVCPFWKFCYPRLKDRNCISLLGGISPKTVSQYNKKGIYSIAQLSHLFRPRRRGRQLSHTKYLWELKALAIREQKTFVLQPPDLNFHDTYIYIDFEGLPDENFQYLLGGVVKQENKDDVLFSFWADTIDNEEDEFIQLISLLNKYPEAPIYHYGSYETAAFKQVAKKYAGMIKEQWPLLEKRMVNLLGYLRTHVYPPTYSNGLKEVASYLQFEWHDEDANGLQSITWRKKWEETFCVQLKEKLVRYNFDDANALGIVHQWLLQLAKGAGTNNVQDVAKMKRHTPYKLQNNKEYGDVFQFISRAAYFDYQRSKIYWRGDKSKMTKDITEDRKPPSIGKGIMRWEPKKVNEVVVIPPLKACPHCGHTKLYNTKKQTVVRQTDIKFTATSIRQHVIEYRAGKVKCASPKCYKKSNNANLRIRHYGDNLFAFVTYIYLNYNISNELVSRLVQEQFGIYISQMYLVMNKHKWWKLWNPEVEYIRRTVLNSPVIHIDDTSIKLDNNRGYVWTFATTHSVFYHLTLNHEADFLSEILKDYKGIIVTDFFPVYETLSIKRQKCLIHLIRDLNDDLFKNPFDEEYKKMVTGFSTLLKSIIQTIDKYGLKKLHLNKHINDVGKFENYFLERTYKSELASKYAKRLKKHWEQCWTFLYHDNVPWNNNNAEAAIKAFAQYRRGIKGQVSVNGMNWYLPMLSISQTCRYRNISFLDFLRRKAGLWQNVPANELPGYLPFRQARLYARGLRFQRREEWLAWNCSGKRPSFIPLVPDRVYKDKGWINWADWLGNRFLPFEKARAYMRALGLKNRNEYREWLKSGKRPKTIPHEPEKIYKHIGWLGLGDWLGTGNIQNQKKKKIPYESAQIYVQSLGIKSWQEFNEWSASGERPPNIPAAPHQAYPQFKSWGDFLGTGRIANQKKQFWNYGQAKEFLAPLNIRSKNHFIDLCKEGIIPKEIPRDPAMHYKKEKDWNSYHDFFSKETDRGPSIVE